MANKDAKAQSTSGDDANKQENATAQDVQQTVSAEKEASTTNVDPTAAKETSKDEVTDAEHADSDKAGASSSATTNAGAGQDYVAPETDDKSKTADEKKAEASGADAPNTAPAAEPEEKEDSAPTVTELAKLVADSSEVSDTLVKSFEERLDKYLEEMAPRKPITLEDAAVNQLYLWDTLRLQLDLPAPAFAKVMDMTLAKIKANVEGAFSQIYLRRGFERISLPDQRRKAFDLYLNLLVRFATLENKARLTQYVDLPRTAAAFPDQKHQTRIQTYFGSFR